MRKLKQAKFLLGDAKDRLPELEEGSVQTAITSPPYWNLRDYGVEGQTGLEDTPEAYVEELGDIFDEVKRVLKDDGTLWLNVGDKYARSSHGDVKPKDMIGLPWQIAFELRRRGWHLRQDIIWKKPDPMPESVTDRCVGQHEYLFLLSKSKDYFFDHEAIQEDAIHSDDRRRGKGRIGYEGKRTGEEGTGQEAFVSIKDKRNKRSVWEQTTAQSSDAHFAPYPVELIEPCVKASTVEGDTVLDPFNGTGTTGIAALKNGRKYIGVDLNEDYIEISKERIVDCEDIPVQHDWW